MNALRHLALFLSAAPALAAPAITHLRVTDITPSALRVIWQTHESAVPAVEIFADPAATVPVAGAVVTPYLQLGDDALGPALFENFGVMAVDVTGLAPDTTYYLRATATSSADATTTTSTLLPATTAANIRRHSGAPLLAPLTNPILRFECLPEPDSEVDSAHLLVVEVAGAQSPVTTLLDDSPTAFVDLNNLFSAATRETLPLAGYEALTLTLYHGLGRTESFSFFVPLSDGLATVLDPYLTSGPLAGPVVRPHRHSGIMSRVFMEFPAESGRHYAIDSSDTLEPGSWLELHGLRADQPRVFFEDQALLTGTPAPPSDTPFRAYRLRDAD